MKKMENIVGWDAILYMAIGFTKEDIKEQPTSRIFQPPQQGFYSVHDHAVSASQKYFSAIHTSPHFTLAFVNNIILHLVLVLCTVVNVRNEN